MTVYLFVIHITIGIHHPKPGKEGAVLETMKTWDAQKQHKEFVTVFA